VRISNQAEHNIRVGLRSNLHTQDTTALRASVFLTGLLTLLTHLLTYSLTHSLHEAESFVKS